MLKRVQFDEKHPAIGASMGAGIKNADLFQKLKLGTFILSPLPETKEEALDYADYCREHGIGLILPELILRHNHRRRFNPELSFDEIREIIERLGPSYLGRYVVCEIGGMLYWPKEYTIDCGIDNYPTLPSCRNNREAREAYVDYIKGEIAFERKEVLDSPLWCSDSSFDFPYIAEAGPDILSVEMMPGNPLLTLSSIRGTAKAYAKPWGAHIAMMWYGGIQADELWLKRWRSALWWAYMSGCEYMLPESGHLMFNLPGSIYKTFKDEELRLFRRHLREMYRFVQCHTRPSAEPDSPVAILFGQDEGEPGIWNPYCWGQYNNGEEWETADTERGWKLFDTLFSQRMIFLENQMGDKDFTGNPPCGQIDIIPCNADFKKYKTLLLIGYNRMSDDLYRKLQDFVKAGGHLMIWLSHFDIGKTRGTLELYNHGDLSELCGIEVLGPEHSDVVGMKFVGQSKWSDCYVFPSRSVSRDPQVIGRSTPAKIRLTSKDTNVLAVYSNTFDEDLDNAIHNHPLLVERKLGDGLVYTVCCYDAPGAKGMFPFAEMLVRVLTNGRRRACDLLTTDRVRYAIYSTAYGKNIYMHNTDPNITQGAMVCVNGQLSKELLLSPAEVRVAYLIGNILISPSEIPVELEHWQDNDISLFMNAQKVRLDNIGLETASFSLNSKQYVLSSKESIEVAVDSHVPIDLAEVYCPDYLEEPEVDADNLSTPY